MPPDPDAAKKDAAAVRGIGLTKAYVYIEDPEEEDGPQFVVVSLTDYFEGETTAIAVNVIKDGVIGASVAGTETERTGAKVAGSDLLLCSKEARYAFPADTIFHVVITYGAIERSADIGPHNRKAWLEWS